MVQSFGGYNDHPDTSAFLLIFRLMSIYSLIKRPCGSNVSGEELFESLLQDCDTSAVTSNLQQWKDLRRQIILHPDDVHSYSNAARGEGTDCIPNARSEEDEQLLQFFGGYIAMKALSFSKCQNCAATLTKSKRQLTLLH